MDPAGSSKPRPYWHLDAKWITAILLLFLLNATFFTFVLVHATGPKQGIELLTVLIASSFSREGLDEKADTEIMQQKIAESPDGSWRPIPGLEIVVREEDITGKTPRQMRLWLFRQLAEPVYYEGEQGLMGLATSPEMAENLRGGIGPFGFISAATHAQLKKVFVGMGLASLILLGLLAYFSYRFGRLATPGCVIFLAAIPGIVMFSGIRGWIETGVGEPDPGAQMSTVTLYTQAAARLAADALPGPVENALRTYLALVFLGLGLMLVALIGTVVFRIRRRKEPAA